MVFPAVLVARAIPKENAAVHGFVDGARAAIDMVKEMQARSLSGGLPGNRLAGPRNRDNTVTWCYPEFNEADTHELHRSRRLRSRPGGFVDRD